VNDVRETLDKSVSYLIVGSEGATKSAIMVIIRASFGTQSVPEGKKNGGDL
jgi:hypothetical protein